MDGSRHLSIRAVFVFSLFLHAVLPGSAAAADKVNAEWYSSVRANSMGNIGITQAEDPASAMFYNPALLANRKKATFEIFNPTVEMGLGNIGISSAISDYSRQMNLRNAYPLLNASKDKPSSFGASIYPNFTAQNFAFGVLGKAESNAYVTSAGGNLIFRSRYLIIPTVGMSVGLFNGRFKFGFAGRFINSTQNDRSVSSPDGYGFVVNAQEGLGVGVDAGFAASLPWAGLPTLAFVARNIGDTSFSQAPLVKIATGETIGHDAVKMTYDGGISFSPKINKQSVFTFGSELRDITNAAGTAYLRHVNLGFEISGNKMFAFRFGVKNGYWTSGFGLNGKGTSLDIGSYAEELDVAGFRKVEDRRVAIHFGGRF